MQSFGVTRTPRRPSRLGQVSNTLDTDDTDDEGMAIAALGSVIETPKRFGWKRADSFMRLGDHSKMFDGGGLKSPEHRLLRKLKTEAHSPVLNIELAVRALSPASSKVPPKSPAKSSRFTPYASSPLRSHVRSASSSPPPEVPSDPFLDHGLETAREPSSAGPIRHKKFTKSGARFSSGTGNRIACSAKQNNPRIRVPQDGPSPPPQYLESHFRAAALPVGPSVSSPVKGTSRPTRVDALSADALVISKVVAATAISTPSAGSRMTPREFRRIHSLVSLKDQGSSPSVIPPSMLDSDEAAPKAKARVSRIIIGRPPLAQTGRIGVSESEGHDGGKIKRTRNRAPNLNPYKRTTAAGTSATSSSKIAWAGEVETIRGALGSMKLSN